MLLAILGSLRLRQFIDWCCINHLIVMKNNPTNCLPINYVIVYHRDQVFKSGVLETKLDKDIEEARNIDLC